MKSPIAWQDPEPPEWGSEMQLAAMDHPVGRADLNLYGATEGARPYSGGGAVPKPRHIPQWERPENLVPEGPVTRAASSWARDQMSGKEFKQILKKHGYKIDLRQRDRSNVMEIEGPQGFMYLRVD